MNKLKRPLIFVVVALFLLGLVLTGCDPVVEDTVDATAEPVDEATDDVVDVEDEVVEDEVVVEEVKDDVTITFAVFSASGDRLVELGKMVGAFEAENPHITVDFEASGFDDYFTQMQTRVASGSAPDTYELNYENFVSYATRDALLSLDDVIVSTGFDTTTINQVALEAFQSDGIQYGLPASFSNVVLVYNAELFDAAGIDYPSSDWTWADEQTAAEAIRALGDDIYGISHPIQFWEFYKVTQQNGGGLFNADQTAIVVNSPQNVETLQFMVDRVLKSNVMPTDAQFAGSGDWDFFVGNRLGMIITGIWAFDHFKNNCDFVWDIEVEPGNTSKATHFFSNGIVVNAKTEKDEASFLWASFMSASKIAAMIRVESQWELAPTTDPDVLAAFMATAPPANKAAVFESLDYLVTPPVISMIGELTDLLNLHLESARTGVATPQEALDACQAAIDETITLD